MNFLPVVKFPANHRLDHHTSFEEANSNIIETVNQNTNSKKEYTLVR